MVLPAPRRCCANGPERAAERSAEGIARRLVPWSWPLQALEPPIPEEKTIFASDSSEARAAVHGIVFA